MALGDSERREKKKLTSSGDGCRVGKGGETGGGKTARPLTSVKGWMNFKKKLERAVFVLDVVVTLYPGKKELPFQTFAPEDQVTGGETRIKKKLPIHGDE